MWQNSGKNSMKKAVLNNHLEKSVDFVQLIVSSLQTIVLFGSPGTNLSMKDVAKSIKFASAMKADIRMTLKYPRLSALKAK